MAHRYLEKRSGSKSGRFLLEALTVTVNITILVVRWSVREARVIGSVHIGMGFLSGL
jgi:hypothetical protein